MGEKIRPIVVVSAINIFEGGPLTILKECFESLEKNFHNDYQIIGYVHKKELFPIYRNIELRELPKSRNSWLYRIYYEYIYFKKESSFINAFLWLSLHDTSPFLKNTQIQAVYCHNPSIFYKSKWSEIKYDYKNVLFSFFYKYLYKININKNRYVIVQQDWIRNAFASTFKLNIKKILVAYPNATIMNKNIGASINSDCTFIYPAFPRVFKNYEVIVEAVKNLIEKGFKDFRVFFTISGDENAYAAKIYNLAQGYDQIIFLGILDSARLAEYYSCSKVLLFPSKLETWGLPLTEFKLTNKPIIMADLPYAKETVGTYDKLAIFNPDSPSELALIMQKALVSDQSVWHSHKEKVIAEPFSKNWEDMFNQILNS